MLFNTSHLLDLFFPLLSSRHVNIWGIELIIIFQASKRILRYIRGTLHHGLAFTPGYSDADWARDPVDHKPITSIVVFFGKCPITWSAKKQTIVFGSLLRLNIGPWHLQQSSYVGYTCFFMIWASFFPTLLYYGVIMLVLWLLLQIVPSMLVPNKSRWTIILCVKGFSNVIF